MFIQVATWSGKKGHIKASQHLGHGCLQATHSYGSLAEQVVDGANIQLPDTIGCK